MYSNIKAKLSETKINVMSHYLNNWKAYEAGATLAFTASSGLSATWMSIQWFRHRKIRTHYTPQQYHRMVRGTGRMGIFIATSLIAAANAEALAETCLNKLNDAATNTTTNTTTTNDTK
ncbi:Hypothetical protein FSTVST1_333 [Faustovirus ST1]|nr:Hypothetical protein FSTVST1_333 [Faustovirus ST1]